MAQGRRRKQTRKEHCGRVTQVVILTALEKYSQTALANLWKRLGLSPCGCSFGTVAALIAGNRAAKLHAKLKSPSTTAQRPPRFLR